MAWHSGRRQVWPRVELGILLLLLVPSFFLSFGSASTSDISFVDVALTGIVRDLGLLALVLYWLWRAGEAYATVGLTAAGAGRELLLGAALFFPFLLVVAGISLGLDAVGLGGERQVPAFLVPQGGGEIALAVVFLVVVAVAEETIFRGYLIRRLQQISGNLPAAVLLSSLLFALGHGYQGVAGLITVGLLGLVLAGVYLWRQSLVAPMVLHFLQNVTGMLLIPLLYG